LFVLLSVIGRRQCPTQEALPSKVEGNGKWGIIIKFDIIEELVFERINSAWKVNFSERNKK